MPRPNSGRFQKKPSVGAYHKGRIDVVCVCVCVVVCPTITVQQHNSIECMYTCIHACKAPLAQSVQQMAAGWMALGSELEYL
jgi:hypothetical protein